MTAETGSNGLEVFLDNFSTLPGHQKLFLSYSMHGNTWMLGQFIPTAKALQFWELYPVPQVLQGLSAVPGGNVVLSLAFISSFFSLGTGHLSAKDSKIPSVDLHNMCLSPYQCPEPQILSALTFLSSALLLLNTAGSLGSSRSPLLHCGLDTARRH